MKNEVVNEAVAARIWKGSQRQKFNNTVLILHSFFYKIFGLMLNVLKSFKDLSLKCS